MVLSSQHPEMVLKEHFELKERLNYMNQQIKEKNKLLYNVETRLENLDIFEQHLTSLNLRCEFLDNQILNLENKQMKTTGTEDFNSKIEWRATETTFENLSTEFQYLKDQLSIANELTLTKNISCDETTVPDSSLDQSVSLFSDNTENISIEDAFPSSNSNDNFAIKRKQHTPKPGKQLLKMESFLNFKDESVVHNNDIDNAIPLKGFKINTINDNPLHEDSPRHVTDMVSTRRTKPKLRLFELPSIGEEHVFEKETKEKEEEEDKEDEGKEEEGKEEEDKEEEDKEHCDKKDKTETVRESDKHVTDIVEESNFNEPEYHELSIIFDHRSHKRHSSFPELAWNMNIHSPTKESVRHVKSHDFNLGFNLNKVSNRIDTPFECTHDLNADHIMFSSPVFTNMSCYDESDRFDPTLSDVENMYCEMDSDEDYGNENATPLIFKQQSRASLRRAKSHESIFSVMSRSTNRFPMREKNLDLKAQTLKWLKPNNPTVSSSTQPLAACSQISTSSNAHDNIVNILHSGVNTNTELTEEIRKSGEEHTSQSWINTPKKLFSLPLPIPISASKGHSKGTQNNDEHDSSWITSLIPNSLFTNPEIGKPINQSHSGKKLKGSVQTYRDFGAKTPISNGPSSSLTIDKYGRRIIKHGYGSKFNENVVTSRVSHTALKEALELDFST